MHQMTLFESEAARPRSHVARVRRGSIVSRAAEPEAPHEHHALSSPAVGLATAGERPTYVPERCDSRFIANEAERIVAALHNDDPDSFEAALTPLLTDVERTRLGVAKGLPHQVALVYDQVVERLTCRWGELTAWPPFGRIVESGEQILPDLRALTLSLQAPSRGLSGRVAFRVERNLRRVSQPIPPPVLECLQDVATRKLFAAFAFLEPLYTSRRHGQAGGQLLRSLTEVRRNFVRPVDPLVVAFLGAGPCNYGLCLPGLSHGPFERGIRSSSIGALVFLIGHWD